MNSKFYKYGAACAIALFASANVNAASCFGDPNGYCLQSTNSNFSINSDGLMEMTIDGITHIYNTDFLVANQLLTERVQGQDLEVLPLAFFDYMDLTQAQSGSTLNLTGLSAGTWGSIDLTFDLQGDAVGSNRSTISQTFSITNTSGAALPLSLFAYTDVDLGGSFGNAGALDDQGALQTFDPDTGLPNSFKQWDNVYQMLASVDIAPDLYEVSIGQECTEAFPDLCYKVYNGRGTMLPSTVDGGPGDLQMAAQWLRTLAPGETFTYTQTMVVSAIPVPGAVWLFGSGLLALVGYARRRKV